MLIRENAETQTAKETWFQYSEVYAGVTGFDSKELLDRKISEILEAELQQHAVIVDFGCGPALLARTLAERGYLTIGIDSSLDMAFHDVTLPPTFSFVHSDLQNPEEVTTSFFKHSGEFADAGYAINSWYATTLPEDMQEPLSLEEALLRRHIALESMASILKEGAPLLIADPLEMGRNLDIKAVMLFIWREISASQKLGKSVKSALFRLLSEETREIMKQNREFRPLVHLFETTDDMIDTTENTGYFKVERIIPGPINEIYHYTGNILVLKARRTSKPVAI